MPARPRIAQHLSMPRRGWDLLDSIDPERRAVWVGNSVSTDDVLASLLGAGIVVQAWLAELPIMDDYARRTRRLAASV